MPPGRKRNAAPVCRGRERQERPYMTQIVVPSDLGNIKALPTRNFLSQDRERQLIGRWQDLRDEKARNELVESFMPLLVREARRFMREKRITHDDFLHDLVAV